MTAQTRQSATRIDLPSDREIVITREFSAPRELLFRAWTDAEIIPRYWGPRYLTTTVETLDPRPGGVWRFVQHDAEGNLHAFNGVYREIDRPGRLVYTFEYEGVPGHIVLETVRFDEHDGKTTVTETSLFASVEDRDGMLQSNMELGVRESTERLIEFLDTI